MSAAAGNGSEQPVESMPPSPPQPSVPVPPPPPGPLPTDADDLTVIGYQPAGQFVAPSPPPTPPLGSPPPAGAAPSSPPAVEPRSAIPAIGLYLAWLIVVSRNHHGRDFRLPEGKIIVGTGDECGIRLIDEPFVSSRHAEFELTCGQCRIRDLESTNGSFVNEIKIHEIVLSDGDRIHLGDTLIVFKCMSI